MSHASQDGPGPRSVEILAGVAEVARRELGREEPLSSDMRLVEDLGLDSLKLLTLAVEVENRFRVCLDDDGREAEIRTVGDLVAAVERRMQ